MNKKELVQDLLLRLKEEIDQLQVIAKETHRGATHEEAKPENKYDTRAIEAGYLAGAQAKRLEELVSDFEALQRLVLIDFEEDAEIGLGALVEVSPTEAPSQEARETYFILPMTGGHRLRSGEHQLRVISHLSPIGRELMGLTRGEVIETETPRGSQELQIHRVY